MMIRALVVISLVALTQCRLHQQFHSSRVWGDHPIYTETKYTEPTAEPQDHTLVIEWESTVDRFTQLYFEFNRALDFSTGLGFFTDEPLVGSYFRFELTERNTTQLRATTIVFGNYNVGLGLENRKDNSQPGTLKTVTSGSGSGTHF